MFKPIKKRAAFLSLSMVLLYLGSCEYENFPEPIPPKQPQETATLVAAYSSSAPVTLNHSFWKKSDYRIIDLEDISTKNLYADGYLNMTGTYDGLSDFNDGVSKPMTMKAAYDEKRLYVLLEWYDNDLDVSAESWLYNGPEDGKKNDITTGWTSQRGSDMVSMAFDINGAKGAAGSFGDVGCLAACHSNSMKPQSGNIDLWKWSLALSDPLGFAMDLSSSSDNGVEADQGKPMAVRNSNGATSRSGPKYEWDGVSQSYTRPDGKATLLDPAFFLLNTVEYAGNVTRGDSAYQAQCANCHGQKAEGGDGPSLNGPGVMNRFSREAFDNSASSPEHGGYTYYNVLTSSQKQDVFSRIKAFSGYHGYYLQKPDGSNADIWAVSNISHISLNPRNERTTYKVLLIRDLETGNNDDIQFTSPSGKSFTFGVSLMDNDGINHIGSVKEVLTFKAK